jgi:hypothetical protein
MSGSQLLDGLDIGSGNGFSGVHGGMLARLVGPVAYRTDDGRRES